MAISEDLSAQILRSLEHQDKINTATTFPRYDSNEIKSALDKLASRSYVTYETHTKDEAHLESEGSDIVSSGASHEARVWAALSEAVDGLSLKELEDKVGGQEAAKVGQMRAFKAKWIGKGDKGKFKAIAQKIDDETYKQLREIQEKHDLADAKVLADLKKRKLVKAVKVVDFEVQKGSEYQVELAVLETDLTAAMLADGSWKTANFKPYNFNALGSEQRAGNLHPLLKMREEFRLSFFQSGFTEMPTSQFVESGFWNFDALFVPQQHPARDLQDTFYVSDPQVADPPRADDATEPDELYKSYWEKVKGAHEKGGLKGGEFGGSIGYRYPWSPDAALNLVLRTHTTASSTKMLFNLAQTARPDGSIPPARLFSIDRVFRNETLDHTHLAEFHQIEGVIADYGLTLGGLMEFMEDFFNGLGLSNLLFKPAYNPYTEPSMEVFAWHEGLGKLIEIANSGIFRPEMLEAMGLPKDLVVFGFGLSLERPTMLRYKIDNIRSLLGHKVDLNFIQNNPAVRLDKV